MSTLGPNFLGIGAQKAGTTWLWTQLKRHPEVWMPPRKELHYFDRNFPRPNYLSEPSLYRRLFGAEQQHLAWRGRMRADMRKSFQSRDWEAFRWYARFYFGAGNDQWYRSLFPANSKTVRGEITPAYSILPDEDVTHILGMFPDLKVILLLRDPVERAWSQVRYDWTRGARTDITNLDEIKTFIESPAQTLRSSYLRMIESWGGKLPPERFFIGFYDEIVTQPAALLERVLKFLGLVPQEAALQDLSRKVHVSREAPIPPEIRRYLSQKYLPDLTVLQQRFGDPVSGWLAKAQAEV